MSERSREKRFDEVFSMVLIIVALSFDILWISGRFPIAEIAVFMFVLAIWAYGNLKGENWEYPMKLGSFNLALILMSNFYIIAMFGDLNLLGLWESLIGVAVLPVFCLSISLALYQYLGDSADREITLGVLLGGTLGFIISMVAVVFLG
ncbi:MAG: hypothetical protein ACTSU3_08330 [Candidatus Thorarchaeota archaeon]